MGARLQLLWRMVSTASTVTWIWSLGGTFVVTALIGWGASAWANVPIVWLVLGLIGIAVLTFMSLVAALARRFPQWAATAPSPVQDKTIPVEERQQLGAQINQMQARLDQSEQQLNSRTRESAALEQQLMSANGELSLARAEADSLRDKLAPPPPPPAPDRELVKVFRAHGLPAFIELFNIWKASIKAMRQAGQAANADWEAWAAMLLEEHEVAKTTKVRTTTEASSRGEGEPFDAQFVKFCWEYANIMVWLARALYVDPSLLKNQQDQCDKWQKLDERFTERLVEHCEVDDLTKADTALVRQNLESQRDLLLPYLTAVNGSVLDKADSPAG